MLTFRFTGADGSIQKDETLTSGMIGKKVKLEFSSEWSNLRKTAVFTAGSVTRDVLDVTDEVDIPAELLAVPMKHLYVGIYGVSSDGKVTPTIRVQGPMIEPGTDPSGDEGLDPDLPVWAQLLCMIGDLRNLNTADKSNLVAAVNEAMSNAGGGAGGYYTPVVTQPSANTMQVSFTPSAATMPAVEPVTINLPGTDSSPNVSSADVGNIKTILGNIMAIINAQVEVSGGEVTPQLYDRDISALIAQNDTLIAALGGSGESEDGGETETPDTPETGVAQTGSVLAIVSGVTATQTYSILDIA